MTAPVAWPERLETDRLVLRRPVAADAAAIFEGYAQDPEVTRYLTWRPHSRVEETEAYLARCQAGWDAGIDLTWTLTRSGEDRVIGMIGLRPRTHMADIGYVLARRYWRQGLMPEAATAVVGLALGRPAIHRVWAVCDVENRASARVLEKAGMEYEGVLRRWILHPNVSAEPRDVLCYARLRGTGSTTATTTSESRPRSSAGPDR
jgi:RimJ/RimL family protein N-acetyltransferase